SDFAFLSRMLESAGVSYYFEEGGDAMKLMLSDAPHRNELCAPPLPYKDDASTALEPYVTRVSLGKAVRPGRYTRRDREYRLAAAYPLLASAEVKDALEVEARLERYHYTPGAFLFESQKGYGTPVADDRGKMRSDESEAAALAARRLLAKRGRGKRLTFETNAP